MPHTHAPARILVADDDIDIRDSLRDWLQRSGYRVELAADGREALGRLKEVPCDVLVTDLRMPGLDGLELLDALEGYERRPQVIFLSGQASRSEAIAALREGRSFDFFEKPLHDMARLTRAIERALQHAGSRPAASPDWPPQGHYGEAVKSVLALLQERYAEPLTLPEVAFSVGYNASYLSDLVTRETGQPFSHWLNVARLAAARRLLVDTDLPIWQVAADCGFTDPSYFARLFRQAEGVTPLSWRKTRRAASQP